MNEDVALVCNNAPIDGVPSKNWDGRAGEPCEGTVELHKSPLTGSDLPQCARHRAALRRWHNKRPLEKTFSDIFEVQK